MATNEQTLASGRLRSLPVIVGGLLVVSTFLVATLLSAYHYKIEHDAAYADLQRSEELTLDKIANRCTVPLATFDLNEVGQILAASIKDDPQSRMALGVLDATGSLQAGVPSKELVGKIMQEAEASKAWGALHSYPEGRLSAMTKIIELKRWDSQGSEKVITVGKIVGVFSPKEVESKLRGILARTIVILLLSASLGVGLSYWLLGLLIVGPIQELVLITRHMGEGRFEAAIGAAASGAASTRELATLRAALSEMAATLLGIVKAIRASSEQVASSARALQQITSQSSSNISQAVQVMSQISQNTSQVAQSTQTAATSSQQVGKSAEDGGKLAVQVVEKMKEAQSSVAAAAGFIHELGKRSDQIGKIVDVITKIADQTNLLSLNAAIEAARAGESGRGFAVVADEVRKLAETSADSTQQITNLIREVQEETRHAIETTEKGNKEVAEGYRLTMEAEKLFSTIAREVSQMTHQMTQVASNTEEVAASTEEATASSEEQSAAMEQVATNARELAQVVEKLYSLVGAFKTD